jgi:hypothetical protein
MMGEKAFWEMGDVMPCCGAVCWYGSYSFWLSTSGASLGGGIGGGATLGISPDFLACFGVCVGGVGGGTSRGAETLGRGGGPLPGGLAVSFEAL